MVSKKEKVSISGVANWILDKLLNASATFSVIVVVAMALFCCLYMMARHIPALNIPGMYDAAKYALIIFPFITAGFAQKNEKHIRIDVVTSRLTESGRLLVQFLFEIISLITTLVFLWAVSQWFSNVWRRGAKTVAIWKIPSWILVGLIFVGMLLLILQIFRTILRDGKKIIVGKELCGLKAKDIIISALLLTLLVVSLLLFSTGQKLLAAIMLLLVLMFSGMPIFLALMAIGVVGLYYAVGIQGVLQAPQTAYSQLNKYELTCLPLFILAGGIMEKGKMIDDLFNFLDAWIGRFTPSLLIITALTGAIISALTGSSAAATVMLTSAVMPMVEKRGINRSLAAGLVSSAGTGSLIPPSTGYVLYAAIAGQSISTMFMAAYIPAFILFAAFITMILLINLFNKKAIFEGGVIRKIPREERPGLKVKLLLTWKAVPVLVGPVLMFVTLYTGFFTPTEAAAFLLVYSLVVTMFIKRTLRPKELLKACVGATNTGALVLCITSMAFIFSTVVTQLRISDAIVALVARLGVGRIGVTIIIFILLILLGMIMNASSMTLITLPILYPVAMSVGMSPLWLGVFMVISCEFGTFTPPFGMSLFIIKGVSGVDYKDILRGALPFAFCFIITLILITIFPELTTWLPTLAGMY